MGCPTGLCSAKVGISLCVSSFFLFHILLFHSLFVFIPSFPYIRLTHSLTCARTHKQLHIHKVISCESSYDLNLIAEFIGQLYRRSNLILPGGIQSQLFVWLPAHPYTPLSFPTVHPHLCPPICFPNISTLPPTPEYTHTSTDGLVACCAVMDMVQ